jgi:tRNA-dihydrouridine synthase B
VTFPTAFQTGSLSLQSPFLLAPLESVSDVGFRALCFRNGAGLTWTEMIRARGVARRNKSTLELIDTHDAKTATGVQLMVTSDRELLDALAVLEELAAGSHPHFQNISSIDLNFGCPSQDIIKIGAGPALLKRRSKLRAIFEALAAYKKGAQLPIGSVSAKIRLGLNQAEQDHKVYLPVVEMANDTLDHITVHARHAKQRSRDQPTWSAIGEAKVHARIPVVGNGDVRSRADAERMHGETGCDAFLIARAAIQNPWCFREWRGGDPPASAEIEEAARTYEETAQRAGTKEKFRAFHRENFARLRGAGAQAPAVIPPNAHLR